MHPSISPFYDVHNCLYNLSFNSNCRILAAEQSYRFTYHSLSSLKTTCEFQLYPDCSEYSVHSHIAECQNQSADHALQNVNFT